MGVKLSRLEEQVKENVTRVSLIEAKVAELVWVLQDLEELTEGVEEGTGLDIIKGRVCKTLAQYQALEGLFEVAEYSDLF